MTGTRARQDPHQTPPGRMMVVGNKGEDRVRVGVRGGGYCRLLLMALGAMYLGCLLFSLPYLCLQVLAMLGPSQAGGGEGDIHLRWEPLPNPKYPDLPQPQPAVIHQPTLQPALTPRTHPTSQEATPKKRRGRKKKHRHRHHHTSKGTTPSTLGTSTATGITHTQPTPLPTTRVEHSKLPQKWPRPSTHSDYPLSIRLPPGHLLSRARGFLRSLWWRGRRTQGTTRAAPTPGMTAQEPARKQDEFSRGPTGAVPPVPIGLEASKRPLTGPSRAPQRTTRAMKGVQTATPNDSLRGDGEELLDDSALDTDNMLYIEGSGDETHTPEPEASGSNEYIPVLDNAMTQSKNESKNVNSTSMLPKVLEKEQVNGTQTKNRRKRSTGALGAWENNSWMQWAKYTAKTVKPEGGCYVCSAVKPKLTVLPAPGTGEEDVVYQESGKQYKEDKLSPFGCLVRLGSEEIRKGWTGIGPLYAEQTKGKKAHKTQENEARCRRDYPGMGARVARKTHHLYEIPEDVGFECFEVHPTESTVKGGAKDVGAFEGRCTAKWVHESNSLSFRLVESSDNGKRIGVEVNTTMLSVNWMYEQDIPLADLWWACGRRWGLRNTLPKYWRGKCARVTLAQQTYIVPWSERNSTLNSTGPGANQQTPIKGNLRRSRRDADDGVYMDIFGQPHNVPRQFKARDEVLAGFEAALPFYGASVGIAKNVQWINYIHYNALRFMNATIDAFNAFDRRLNATTKMAMETRIAVDWILAKEGGVCAIVGTDSCCTYVPGEGENMDDFTNAMKRLKAVNKEAYENSGKGLTFDGIPDISGIFAPVTRWLTDTFGSWGGKIVAFLGKLLLGAALVVGMFCCITQCCGKVCSKVVARQLMVQNVMIPWDEEDESERILLVQTSVGRIMEDEFNEGHVMESDFLARMLEQEREQEQEFPPPEFPLPVMYE
ncbi:uncharacterized protein LOC143101434 [Alosa pseudoharengus]|uniref:uncharacterized protein LOC143101434 n=2 Tax=Alosa pseudoharengus TaxID=34774 RepID=UPI003F8C0D1E